ncbi:efflux RND transporter periplasmic adaptor subunit [Cyanobium sp. BA20m-p-22]|uniref:efflux RND transporter periplasmic adaptor subunit n=1 Tax=Cyanobium sp. BA20m-p-22 TaxID=2823704 RepID=UPI0020CBA48D|nr:efflux RND transporter periplasmic adaptor subunit [Cyanobium sp. BA20m-p-22]
MRRSVQPRHPASLVPMLAFPVLPVLLATLVGCVKPPPPPPQPTFSLTSPARQAFTDQATYQSTLESIANVPLAAEIDGRMVAMSMREGQMVRPGELLFRLDQIQQQASLAADAAEARKDRFNAERYIFLNEQGAVSTKQRDAYVTQAISSDEKVRASSATLAYKDVKAPIAGMVGDIQHKLGAVVRQGETITNIVDNRSLWVRLDVPGELAYRVRLGMPVELQAPDKPALKAIGKVTFIAPSLDRRTQTLLVKATFENPDGALRDQQRVQASLRFGREQKLAIPQAAVLLQAGQTFVFRAVQPAEAQRLIGAPITPAPSAGALVAVQTPVTLGSLQGGRFAVIKGLSSSDAVVLGNLAQLRSGMVIPRR